MSKKADLAKNTFILASGRLSLQLVSFVLLPLYTIYLTPDQYGLVDLVITYVTLIVPVLLLQLDRGAFRYLIDSRGDKEAEASIIKSAFKISTTVLTFALVIYFLAAGLIGIPHYYLIAFLVISTAINNLLMQISRGLGFNIYYAKASLVSGIALLTAAPMFVVLMGLGVSGVLLASVVSNALGIAYLLWRLGMYRYAKVSKTKVTYSKEILQYSLPLIPSNISWWAINAADRTIITVVLGVAANGIYAVANRYASIFTALYAIFDMSWTESASMHINSKDRDRYFSDIHNASLRLFGALGLLMIAGMPIVFNLLVGIEFRDSYNYYPILVLAAFSGTIVAQYSAIYIAKKLTGKVFVTSMSAAAINIVLNIVFIKYFGLYAAAISTVIAYLVMGIFRAFDTKKYVDVRYDKILVAAMVLCSGIVFALYYVNNPVLNIVNILFAVATSYYINRSLAKKATGRVLAKLAHYKLA